MEINMAFMNIEKSVDSFRELLNIVNKRMEMTGEGNSVPTTVFAKEISPQFDVEWSVVYNMMKFIAASSDNMEIAKGPKGGLRFKRTEEKVATETKIGE